MKERQSFRGRCSDLSKSSSNSFNSYSVQKTERYLPFGAEEPVFEFDINSVVVQEDDVFSICNDELLIPNDPKEPEIHDPQNIFPNDSVSDIYIYM
jgi:hypothetical protein